MLTMRQCPCVRNMWTPRTTRVVVEDLLLPRQSAVADAGSAAVYTDIARGLDTQLWVPEAYLIAPCIHPVGGSETKSLA
jgi:hypothetical protein